MPRACFSGPAQHHTTICWFFTTILHKLKFRTKAQSRGCVRYNRQLEPQKLICTAQKNKKLWLTKTLTENRKSKNKTCQNHTFWIGTLKYLSRKLAFTFVCGRLLNIISALAIAPFFGVFSFLKNTKLNLTKRFTGETLAHNRLILLNLFAQIIT